MAVEDTKTPCGEDEQGCAGKKYANETNSEFAFFALEAGRDGEDEIRRCQHADKDEHRNDERENREDRARHARRFAFVMAREQVRVDGNEGGRERAFAEEILQEIRDAKGGCENVCGVGGGEVISEDALACEADETAQENSGSDESGVLARAFDALWLRLLLLRRKFARDRADGNLRLARDDACILMNCYFVLFRFGYDWSLTIFCVV